MTPLTRTLPPHSVVLYPSVVGCCVLRVYPSFSYAYIRDFLALEGFALTPAIKSKYNWPLPHRRASAEGRYRFIVFRAVVPLGPHETFKHLSPTLHYLQGCSIHDETTSSSSPECLRLPARCASWLQTVRQRQRNNTNVIFARWSRDACVFS